MNSSLRTEPGIEPGKQWTWGLEPEAKPLAERTALTTKRYASIDVRLLRFNPPYVAPLERISKEPFAAEKAYAPYDFEEPRESEALWRKDGGLIRGLCRFLRAEAQRIGFDVPAMPKPPEPPQLLTRENARRRKARQPPLNLDPWQA